MSFSDENVKQLKEYLRTEMTSPNPSLALEAVNHRFRLEALLARLEAAEKALLNPNDHLMYEAWLQAAGKSDEQKGILDEISSKQHGS